MMRNAGLCVIRGDNVDRQRGAGCGKAKRSDQKVAAGCDQFKF
jgi:hypothetical protein